ncbi:MAG: HyaD/HybD family hydrogenase maturation endopeptidase [Gammaproteobacteria bacterium]|jgi:hydrogenase maturation protease
MDTLILGLGNTLLMDEGVGVHIVRRLAEEGADDQIQYMDGGTLSFTLAGPLYEAKRLIVVDTADLDAEPGTMQCFENGDMDHFVATGKKSSVHEVGLNDLLSITRLEGHLPEPRALIAIQPKMFDWGEEPTPELNAVIPQACNLVRQTLERWDA